MDAHTRSAGLGPDSMPASTDKCKPGGMRREWRVVEGWFEGRRGCFWMGESGMGKIGLERDRMGLRIGLYPNCPPQVSPVLHWASRG